MNEYDKEKLSQFLYFYIKTFLSDCINEFSVLEGNKWDGHKYIIESGNILIEVLDTIKKELKQEHNEIVDIILDRNLINIGK